MGSWTFQIDVGQGLDLGGDEGRVAQVGLGQGRHLDAVRAAGLQLALQLEDLLAAGRQVGHLPADVVGALFLLAAAGGRDEVRLGRQHRAHLHAAGNRVAGIRDPDLIRGDGAGVAELRSGDLDLQLRLEHRDFAERVALQAAFGRGLGADRQRARLPGHQLDLHRLLGSGRNRADFVRVGLVARIDRQQPHEHVLGVGRAGVGERQLVDRLLAVADFLGSADGQLQLGLADFHGELRVDRRGLQRDGQLQGPALVRHEPQGQLFAAAGPQAGHLPLQSDFRLRRGGQDHLAACRRGAGHVGPGRAPGR